MGELLPGTVNSQVVPGRSADVTTSQRFLVARIVVGTSLLLIGSG
ncbi:hypothetical protein [Streptomyces prasinus]